MGKKRKRRIAMSKVREIIRLHEEGKLSNRQIARAVGVSRPAVADYLRGYRKSGLSWTKIEKKNDDELEKLFGKKKRGKEKRYKTLENLFPYFVNELKRVGVTRHLLWKEYKEKNPDGYSYSQFCDNFKKWRKGNDCPITMHLEHRAGDKMFVDFTGKKFPIYDPGTGEKKELEVFVAILPASQLTYVEAVESQQMKDWIKANENALRYFGGVPRAIVPDCLKSGVINGNKYEPDVNRAYSMFARHYGTVILPARPHSPKDKAMVENAVKITYTRVFAPMRNERFFSVQDSNIAIRVNLDHHNDDMSFQRTKVTRREYFKQIEKEELMPLPSQRYEWKEFLTLTVQFNYHIELRRDNHYYSVPYKYRGKKVDVHLTGRNVEIYYRNERIAFHRRSTRSGYSTRDEHMPSEHRFYSQWSPERFINWASKYGNDVKKLVKKVLESRRHPEQAYKSCMGILHLADNYGSKRLNNACSRALSFDSYSYKTVKNILRKGLDTIEEEPVFPELLPEHENIRGDKYYN